MAVTIRQMGGVLQDTTPSTGIIRHQVFLWVGGQIGICSLHFTVTQNAAGDVLAGELAAYLQAHIHDQLSLLVSPLTYVLGSKVSQLDTIPLRQPGLADDDQMGSVLGAVPMPLQTCGMLRLSTVLAGKSNRGRLFIPFPTVEFDDDDGTPTGAYITALNNLGLVWATSQTSAPALSGGTMDLVPCIYHRGAHTWSPINGYYGLKKWGVQHRRGSYGRPNARYFS